MQLQGGRDNRGAPVARSRPYAGRHTFQDERIELHRAPQGQEYADDVRQARQPEAQVRKLSLLVRRLLCDDRRPERGDDRKYIREQEANDIALDKLSVKEYKNTIRKK